MFRRFPHVIIIMLLVGCSSTATVLDNQSGDSLPEVANDENNNISEVSDDISPIDKPDVEVMPVERLQPEDLVYLGAIRLPEESTGSSWEYSGQGLAYFMQGDRSGEVDGFPGSLFGIGFDQELLVSEISIPPPVISKSVEDLNIAQTIQPFSAIHTGLVDLEQMSIPVAGLAYLPPTNGGEFGRLHFCFADHLDDGLPTHGSALVVLSQPHSEGLWYLGGYSNFTTCDYIFEIPGEWAQTYTPGMNLATGRFREGVWGGRGPALFAYAPIHSDGIVRHATPLLIYGNQQEGGLVIDSDENTQMTTYMEADHWTGGAWLTAGESSAVIFVGTKAMGSSWYGFGNGVVWDYECQDQDPPTCPEVPEWPYDDRGYWAEGYQAQIIFYDPSELGAVALGIEETYFPQPYAVLDLTPYLFKPELNPMDYKRDLLGAAAFDRENGFLYIVERLADEYRSVIHVFQVTSQ